MSIERYSVSAAVRPDGASSADTTEERVDVGAILRKEPGPGAPKILRLVIENPLVMYEMTKHVPDAASYAPVAILIDERPDGVQLSSEEHAQNGSHPRPLRYKGGRMTMAGLVHSPTAAVQARGLRFLSKQIRSS